MERNGEHVTAASPAGVPPDLPGIKATAKQAIVVTTGPLPRYTSMTAMTAELAGFLRRMIEVTEDRRGRLDGCRAWAHTADAVLAEAHHRVDLPPGDGLQSAADHVHALAHVLLELCRLYPLADRDGD